MMKNKVDEEKFILDLFLFQKYLYSTLKLCPLEAPCRKTLTSQKKLVPDSYSGCFTTFCQNLVQNFPNLKKCSFLQSFLHFSNPKRALPTCYEKFIGCWLFKINSRKAEVESCISQVSPDHCTVLKCRPHMQKYLLLGSVLWVSRALILCRYQTKLVKWCFIERLLNSGEKNYFHIVWSVNHKLLFGSLSLLQTLGFMFYKRWNSCWSTSFVVLVTILIP